MAGNIPTMAIFTLLYAKFDDPCLFRMQISQCSILELEFYAFGLETIFFNAFI